MSEKFGFDDIAYHTLPETTVAAADKAALHLKRMQEQRQQFAAEARRYDVKQIEHHIAFVEDYRKKLLRR